MLCTYMIRKIIIWPSAHVWKDIHVPISGALDPYNSVHLSGLFWILVPYMFSWSAMAIPFDCSVMMTTLYMSAHCQTSPVVEPLFHFDLIYIKFLTWFWCFHADTNLSTWTSARILKSASFFKLKIKLKSMMWSVFCFRWSVDWIKM